MILTYRYRIYPTPAQEKRLGDMLFAAFLIYNDSLRAQRDHYSATGEALNYGEIAKYWTRVAKFHPDHPVARLPNDTRTRLLKWQEIAYKEFYKAVKAKKKDHNGGRRSLPHFRKLRDTRTVPFRGRSRERLREYHMPGGLPVIYLQGIGEVKTVYHRPVPHDARILWANVTKEGGKWFVGLQCEFEVRDLPPDMVEGAVGIDIGLHYVIATSDGDTVPKPGYLHERLKELRRLQRKEQRQRRTNNPHCYNEDGTIKRGVKLDWWISSRHKETLRRVNELHGEVKRQREYFWNVITDELTRRYHVICLEDLTLNFMKQNKRLSQSVADAAPGMFWRMLAYKAAERGCRLVWVPAAYTSQTCSECGHVSAENRKTQAVFCCEECGHAENADVNAAKNILARGLSQVDDRTDVAEKGEPV